MDYQKKVFEYFDGDDLAASVWIDKYALKDDKTRELVEKHPTQMFERIAKELTKIEVHYRRKEHYLMTSLLGNKTAKLSVSNIIKNRARSTPSPELIYKEILQYMDHFKYIVPGGSILSSLGTNKLGSLSNCFVIGQPEDSFNSIFQKRLEQANLMKRRGGVGKDISLLRPKGATVKNVALTSSGAPSFMQVDSEVTREVAMDGRRGALLESISVKHPDILDFIKAKMDKVSVTAANVSIKITKDFMEAVKADSDYILRWPVDSNPRVVPEVLVYNKLTPVVGGGYVKKVRAKEIWDEFIKCSWDSAEPGLLFEDAHINQSPDGVYDQYRGISTNPCGEIFMQPYDSCRLIHLNLFSFVVNPFTKKAEFNYGLFQDMVYNISCMADNIIDLEVDAINRILDKLRKDDDPLAKQEIEMWLKIKSNALDGRRCGIGFTGLGDVIAALGLNWNEGFNTVKQIMYTKFVMELVCQVDMAIIRGKFKGQDSNKEFYVHDKANVLNCTEDSMIGGRNLFYETIANSVSRTLLLKLIKFGRRNVSWSAIAPTGTISIETQTTSGIEPLFLPFYERNRKVSGDESFDFVDATGEKFKKYLVIHKGLKLWWEANHLNSEYSHIKDDDWKSIFEISPYFNNCSADIKIEDRLLMQSIVQHYTTHSISSTLNLPKSTTIPEVNRLFLDAYDFKLKGVTIYREGSRTGILNTIKEATEEEFTQHKAPKRPKVLPGFSHIVKSRGDEYTIIIGFMNNKPYEVFAALNPPGFVSQKGTITKIKKGVYQWLGENGDKWGNIITLSNNLEERACTLYTSMLLRTGAHIPSVIKTARKVDDNISSFTSALCRVLAKYTPKEVTEDTCPECGSKLIREAGCKKCSQCTYSLCLIAYEVKNKI